MIAASEPLLLEQLAYQYRISRGQHRAAFDRLRSVCTAELADWIRAQNPRLDAEHILNMSFARLDLVLLDRSQPLQPIKSWLYSTVWRQLRNSAHDSAQ